MLECVSVNCERQIVIGSRFQVPGSKFQVPSSRFNGELDELYELGREPVLLIGVDG